MHDKEDRIEEAIAEPDKEKEGQKKPNIIKEIIQQIIIALVLFFILIKFVLIPCEVDGTSMYPTLHEGDFGYSFIITRTMGIKRFDIVVIKLEDDKDKLLVKRVVGMPGEKMEYRDNKLYINGEYVEETFLGEGVHTSDFETVLGDDEYFCMGDNRSVSRDSRYYGSFKGNQIVSSHLFILKPLENMGIR